MAKVHSETCTMDDAVYEMSKKWVCDACGEEYLPNMWMPELLPDTHFCEKCITEAAIMYFYERHAIGPRIMECEGKQYTVDIQEFNPLKNRRKNIPKKTRDKVLSSGECKKCGSKENLQVDHIIPVSKGGNDEMDNLQPLCADCNREKGAN